MIYQESNLPVWAQLVLMACWLLALVLLLYIKPREDVKQETKETTHRPRPVSYTHLVQIEVNFNLSELPFFSFNNFHIKFPPLSHYCNFEY